MAYLGSTAASSVANPPTCIIPKIIGGIPGTTTLSTANGNNVYQEQGGALWLYKSSHGTTAHAASNFFTDAKDIGIRPGDIMIGLHWTTAGSSLLLSFAAIQSVSTAGAAVAATSIITSTYG